MFVGPEKGPLVVRSQLVHPVHHKALDQQVGHSVIQSVPPELYTSLCGGYVIETPVYNA